MVEKHEGWEERVHTFDQAWEKLETTASQQLTTRAGTPFVARASITTKGHRKGERVISYFQQGKEYGRSYECCWEHYYNCNCTRIGMYSRAVDDWFGSTRSTSKLTRRELLGLIEENGGPERLDLRGKDLSKLDLGRDAIAQELEERDLSEADPLPTWVYIDEAYQPHGGTNLRQVILKEADLGEVNLRGASLANARLEGARLGHTNLEEVDLVGANLQGASLWYATLRRARLHEANLRGADLEHANLEGAGLVRADLQGANLRHANLQDVDLADTQSLEGIYLFRARLERTNLTREQLGEALGEDKIKQYHEAKEAYLALKNNFESIGRYDDASWAYMKERRMEKMMNHPRLARGYYEVIENLRGDGNWRSKKLWGFYFRHTLKWVTDWGVEVVCGYGESIARVLGTLAVVYVLFTIIFGLTGSVVIVDSGTVTSNPVDWLIFSLGALTTMDPASLRGSNNIVELIAGFEALLGIFLTGLLGFVVANRIRRS